MSFASEAAFTAPPLGRPFDFSKALADARRVLMKRVIPNLCDDVGFVYRKTTAFAALLATPLFKMEEHCGTDFDLAKYPKPDLSVLNRELRRMLWRRVGMPATVGVAFLGALFAHGNLVPTKTNGSEEAFLAFSARMEGMREKTPTYVRTDSPEWRDARAAVVARNAERSASRQLVDTAPVHNTALQRVQGIDVTSFIPDDEYVDF